MEETMNQMSVLCIKTESHSGDKDLNHSSIVTSVNKHLLDNSNRHSFNCIKISTTKKAKRIRFFRNGDKFYNGVVVAVTPERYRSFDSLISDLTRALISNVTLPNGVRVIYTMDGKKVQDISDLEDGKCYVVSGQGEVFKKVDYSSSAVKRGSSMSGLPSSPAINTKQIISNNLSIKAKIITLIRNGIKPRKIVRLLLNKRNSPSIDHVLEAITEVIKLDSGAARKVYSLSGHQITQLEQFFSNEEIFIVYGLEKPNHEDFELDFEELKCVQGFHKGLCIKKHNGPMPKMPARKIDKKLSYTLQVRTPSPSALNFPNSLKLNYSIGHVIGDGNFAIVRQCTHKLVF
jgi:doublecortin-like kinase 1/2